MNNIFTSSTYRNLSILLLLISLFLAGTTKAATYNSVTGELFLPHLINGTQSLLNVVIKLNPGGTYVIQNGTESPLPFICSGNFTSATFDLIKSAKGKDEVNSILGCHWYNQQRTLINEQNNPAFSWLDASCQTLAVVFDESSNSVSFSSVEKNTMGCSLYTAFYPYDISKKLFYLQYVKVDNMATASDVYIKFTEGNRYELVSYLITPNNTPPTLCSLITEEKFNTIDISMSPDDISNLLGCQWGGASISSDDPATLGSYTWIDHEWNHLYFYPNASNASLSSKTFMQFRIGNTPD